MPLLTLGQAAKATGRSKAGILSAIKNGRLSASRDDKNQWQIDPVELHRVYPLTVNQGGVLEQNETELNTSLNTKELRHSKEKIELLERIVGNLENERDDLRRRLDQSEEAREQAAAETRRLTLLITHERQQPEAEASSRGKNITPQRFGGVFWLVVALLLMAGVAAYWWIIKNNV